METEALVSNEIKLKGKVSQQSPLRYTPAGFPVREFILAVQQNFLNSLTVGYFDVVVTGDLAERSEKLIKIGSELNIVGSLWSRQYRNRQGVAMKEVKVVASTVSE